jgi:hypothetical protein
VDSNDILITILVGHEKEERESERMRRRLEAENDDLNIKLDVEIKCRQKMEKTKRLISATHTRLDASCVESLVESQPVEVWLCCGVLLVCFGVFDVFELMYLTFGFFFFEE